jgi:PII-like signaling protein
MEWWHNMGGPDDHLSVSDGTASPKILKWGSYRFTTSPITLRESQFLRNVKQLVINVKRRHQYDLQHLREPFIERHMFEATEGSTIYNSVRGNNHSGYHTSEQHYLQLRNAVTAPVIRHAGYILVPAINKYHDHHKLENVCTHKIEDFPVLHPCCNLALPSNIVTVSCKSLLCPHLKTTYKLRGWPIHSVGNTESKDGVNDKTGCARSGPVY